MTRKELLILTPFELPDVRLVSEVAKTAAYPVLALGYDRKKAEESLEKLASTIKVPFGVCMTDDRMKDISLPKQVTRIIVPFGTEIPVRENVEFMWQVYSIEEAEKAIQGGFKNIIIKGNEGAGKVAEQSSFIMFQALAEKCKGTNINLYIQGGAGVHSSAAYTSLGAKGVIMDSQMALFPACGVGAELKETCAKLSGNETIVIDGYRVLHRKNSPKLPQNAKVKDVLKYVGGYDMTENYIPMGQDISLAVDFVNKYKKLTNFVAYFFEAAYGHLKQAKTQQPIRKGNSLAQEFGTKYPIIQGPMARVSDVPEFINSVAEAGALPFLALSLMFGQPAVDILNHTKEMLGDKPWGVGTMGFIPTQLREEQTKYILDVKPDFVLIAGGRPSLAKPYEDAGITTYLHVPSVALLDMFLKEKARKFIFEGRESGGHVGPLASIVLWEKQIFRLLQEDDIQSISVLFAGGIHNALSSAFVSIMSATLAVKGAKIGIQMGTSYLYAKESVESAAITQEYQNQIISSGKSILLEAAPGQETRSIKTPFTDFFKKEKQRMISAGMDSKDIWFKLEEMNLGRSRIAAKGLKRDNGKLIELSTDEQLEEGLYMVGDVVSLMDEVTTMDEIHEAVIDKANDLIENLQEMEYPETSSKGLNVAIIGMEAIYPGAHNIEEYWKNIFLSKDCVTEVPDDRWNKELFFNPDTRDTDYICSKWGGFIPDMDFDPTEFGITPQSVASIEPVQLLSLLVAKRALQDAGYDTLSEIDADSTSVIFGTEGATELATMYGFRASAKQAFGELPEEVKTSLPVLNEDSFAGVLSNVVAGRIANRLNLGGRNFTVDAACASSMAALDIGCQELANHRSDMVLLGGADLHNGLADYLMFNCTHALSRKGYSASFDADSDGIALGEGIGVLVLKRLEDAERDGNKIYAVIKGVGGSSDGKSLGMTAPSRKGQIKALERAYQTAGILPSEVGLIEAHGTGTVVGDKTELSALTDMFLDSGALPGQSYLGSVKTQIGHTKCSAGIAGVMKAALAVKYGIIPPTIHLNKPNAFYKPEINPFLFNTRPGLWNSERRIAGISAFGFGGTNFHTVIENYNKDVNYLTALPAWPSEIFVFRGKDRDEAVVEMNKVKEILLLNDSVSLKNLAYTLAITDNTEIQIIIVATSPENLISKIDIAAEGKNAPEIYYRDVREGKVAFLFPGQGSQRVNMARDLFVAFPVMRKLIASNPDYERILFPETIFDEEKRKELEKVITDTRNAQPLLGIVDFAMAGLLKSFGIEPDMAAGHSYGELPALAFAGVINPHDLVALSRKRAQAILNAIEDDKGMMGAVNIPQGQLDEILKEETQVWAVNYNSSKQTVLAGTTKGMEEFIAKMKDKGISVKKLNVACAFHSPLLRKSKEIYAETLEKVKFGKAIIPVWSNTTAERYPLEEAGIKERLCEHLVNPVYFSKQLEKMYEDGARIFIEAGPGRTLTGLVQNTITDDEILTIQTEADGKEGVSYFLQAVAKYIASGREVNFMKMFEGRNAVLLDISDTKLFTKKPTVWKINGHYSRPLSGKMPADGAYPITKPFNLLNDREMNNNNRGAADDIMLEYLKGMNSVVQNQRDVMMSYFGQTAPMASPQIQARPVEYTPAISQPQQVQLIEENKVENLVAEEVGSSLPSAANLTTQQLTKILLDVVSDKTGYPVEMLGMDMDMEADLSIDSIKRIEIIGALKERVDIGINFEESENAIETLASLKTLNEIIKWIADLKQSGSGNPSKGLTVENSIHVIEVEPSGVKIGPKEDVAELTRLCFTLQEHAIDNSKSLSIEGKVFALPVKEPLVAHGAEIKKALEEKGAIVEIVAQGEDLTSFDGLILVDIAGTSDRYNMKDLFDLTKKVDFAKMKWLFTFSDQMAQIEKDAEEVKNLQGYPGFIKSLAMEYPGLKVRNIASVTPFDVKKLGNIVAEELSAEDKSIDIFYDGDKRMHYAAKSEKLNSKEEVSTKLDKDSVVLVLGGAQGITPELITQLAVDYPCNYILVGRSKPMEGGENPYSILKTKDEIRKLLIHEGEYKKPADIEKRVNEIYKSNQINAAIEKVSVTGAKVAYRAADVQDKDAFRELILDVRKEYGHIDGVIHAAGILEDKLFSDKTWESFENVYNTKVNPLQVIVDELLGELKLLVMFSSVSAAYGNRGQCDYAAANSVFEYTAIALDKKSGIRVVAFDWGPWKGAGMVNASLESEFEKRGVSMIPLRLGGEYFVNELKYGNEAEVLVMGGDVDNFVKIGSEL